MTTKTKSTVTVVDVAREARVSPMTVSRVMNGNTHVGVELRDRVLAAAERTGYRPSLAGRALRAQRSTHIGVLYGNPSPAYLNQMMLGMLEEGILTGAQIQVERCNTKRSYSSAVKRLLEASVDGIILPSPVSDSQVIIHELQASNIAVVAAGVSSARPDVPSVGMDDYKAACAMTRYVMGLGHRRIAFIRGDMGHTPARLRTHGFVDTMRKGGFGIPESYLADGKFTYRSGLAAAAKLLSLKNRPTAILCSNDDMAAAVVAVALSMGVNVPQDLSVTGFDDTPIATTIWPQLTTVHQPVVHLGRVAIRLLVEELAALRRGDDWLPRHEALQYRIVKRGSTGTPDSGSGI